ncbi:glycoside hydrolase family 104 protein [Acinetobacter guillouiae]|uniref:glycoside hydrolase family 24 protein n=1 Tax=Acinetobacter guillouiae TaxID=106649 RepID=UPI0030084F6C
MARQQYESLLNNPNVRTMLNLIAQTEGVKWGYNTLFGNQKIDNLSAHPNLKKQFTQTNGKINYTTAAGRYQFIKPTWDGLVGQLGLKDFSPRSQDIGAIALLAENGALPYVLKGDYKTAVRKSGGTWASLPSSNYAQPKRGWDFISKQLGSQVEQQSQQEYKPEYVPQNLLQAKSTYKAEYVPKENLTQQGYQPEYVPQQLLGG